MIESNGSQGSSPRSLMGAKQDDLVGGQSPMDKVIMAKEEDFWMPRDSNPCPLQLDEGSD